MINLKITDVRENPGDSAFLIDDGKTAIMYDSGFAFTGYKVADRIKKELGGRKLDYIFLTHSHYDHVLGSCYALKYWPEAKVVAGEYAVKIFAKPTAKELMRDLDQKYAAKCGVDEYEDLIDDLKVDISVCEGDTIEAGNMHFTVINLPGHTRCSIGFYMQENKLLLGSETIGVYDGEETVLPSYLVGYELALDSISKVEKLNVENILVPHFGVLDKEKTQLYLKKARKSAVDAAEEIVRILKSGGTKELAVERFKEIYFTENVRKIYPIDAMNLNTDIMVNLIERELVNT